MWLSPPPPPPPPPPPRQGLCPSRARAGGGGKELERFHRVSKAVYWPVCQQLLSHVTILHPTPPLSPVSGTRSFPSFRRPFVTFHFLRGEARKPQHGLPFSRRGSVPHFQAWRLCVSQPHQGRVHCSLVGCPALPRADSALPRTRDRTSASVDPPLEPLLPPPQPAKGGPSGRRGE